MNKGLYSFVKNDELFVVICKTENPTEWKNLRELDGWEVESDDQFYIMGTDARAEIEETEHGKLLTYKANEIIYFKCSITNEVTAFLKDKETIGFFLIQSEISIDEKQVYKMFKKQEIESLICAFYTENKKREIFELDEKGNILGLK
ncbi:MAG: hypothetical protein ACK5MZ_08585 [Aestuariibaculum sp.]